MNASVQELNNAEVSLVPVGGSKTLQFFFSVFGLIGPWTVLRPLFYFQKIITLERNISYSIIIIILVQMWGSLMSPNHLGFVCIVWNSIWISIWIFLQCCVLWVC